MQTLFLDKTGECEPPSDALVITTEVSFLEHLGKTSALVVRGESLCRWAEYLWLARGGPVVSLLSPVDELMECTLGADRGVVAQFYEEHAAILNQLPRPIRLQSVLEAVYPTEMWRGLPNVRHAAQWLLWLDETDPPSTVSRISLANRHWAMSSWKSPFPRMWKRNVRFCRFFVLMCCRTSISGMT